MRSSVLEKSIHKHLTEQYAGILSESMIQKHMDNYVGDNQSQYLIAKITPLIPDNAAILDIGSGYGSFVCAANKKGYDCYGIELAEFEHKISQEKALAEGLDPSKFIKGSALALPFPDKKFDVITFWNVMEHINDYKAAIGEAHRVLKPGGKMFIIAPNYCTFRSEAHYHVPWFPLFPKPLARIYLKALGKNPRFLDECIFYITSFGLKRTLHSYGLSITTDFCEKICSQYTFQSVPINTLARLIRSLGLAKPISVLLYWFRTHPFCHSIDVVATK